jgi:thiol-disulfide isomerase/thioredoxin
MPTNFSFITRALLLIGCITALFAFMRKINHTAEIINEDAQYNFQLKNIDGTTLDVNTLKGKTIFINFWATWCGPCVAEMPSINQIYQQYGKSVVFLMISLDNKAATVQKFMQKKQYGLPVYTELDPIPPVYNYENIPATYVVSPEGKIVFSQIGHADYNTPEFKQLLDSLIKK